MPIMDWWKARHGAVEDVGGHTCLAPPPRKGKAGRLKMWAVTPVSHPLPEKARHGRWKMWAVPTPTPKKGSSWAMEDVGGQDCPHLFPGKTRQMSWKMWVVTPAPTFFQERHDRGRARCGWSRQGRRKMLAVPHSFAFPLPGTGS